IFGDQRRIMTVTPVQFFDEPHVMQPGSVAEYLRDFASHLAAQGYQSLGHHFLCHAEADITRTDCSYLSDRPMEPEIAFRTPRESIQKFLTRSCPAMALEIEAVRSLGPRVE